MSFTKQGIPPENFYCVRNSRQDEIEAILEKESSNENPRLPKFMTQLLGPSTTWKIFKKQQDAINCCFHRRNGLMAFAYEDINARRMFLAAHPKVFWGLNSHRFFRNCSSYEIITEYSVCKLYLDLEYEYAYNCDKNGEKMLDTLLQIININLKNVFNINCTKEDILDLESCSDTKFSHHVIYEIVGVAFQHNYAVGNFMKKICAELKEAFECNATGDSAKLHNLGDKYSLSPNDILQLFVQDRKGQTKLFVDEGVYTKNRHFRLLGSSKLAKGIPLKISQNNKYKPNKTSEGLEHFLDSLVNYFSWKVERILEFENCDKFKFQKTEKTSKSGSMGAESYIHPQINSFVNGLIAPKGWIRKTFFFSDTSTIVYDIQGYRFCNNIQREHKNNNIMYVVDLKSLRFYQKCHDPDCANFRSEAKCLPEEICFLFEDDSLFLSGALDCEDLLKDEFVWDVENIDSKDDFVQGISDEVLEGVLDCTEAILDW